MTIDLKRELLRHLVATLAFRAKVAISDAKADFATFKINQTVRTPGEILAHLGDLLEGSLRLMKGEFVRFEFCAARLARRSAKIFLCRRSV